MFIIKKLIRYIFYILFLPFWHLERLIPRNKNIWVFGSLEGKKYGDNSRTFFEYVTSHHPEITAIWLTRNKVIYELLCSKNINVFMLCSIKGIIYSLAAKYYITDHGLVDLNIYASNGAKKISLWHGMPLKKMGFFDNEYFKNQRFFMLRKRILSIICPYYTDDDSIDLLIASSDFFKPFLSSSFASIFGKKLPLQKIITTGLPRNDNLFKKTKNSLIAGLREKYNNCRIIVYMPTFRLGSYNNVPFSPFTGFGFDASVFSDFLENENIIFLYKPHPYDSNLPDFRIADRFVYLKGTEYDDLYDFLGNIDILATDYSSIYFDFLLTGKPVILTPFDLEEYIKIRGLYFDYNTYMDGIKAYNWNDFMGIVRHEKYYAIQDINGFNYYKDASSCERVFNAIDPGRRCRI